MAANQPRVFVYGTLKKGHGNHVLLEESKYLGRASIKGQMLNMGYFPGVIDGDKSCDIWGEVYSVSEDTLYSLDMLEGHPRWYERFKVDTIHGKAWVYKLPDAYASEYSVMDTGVWRPSSDELEELGLAD